MYSIHSLINELGARLDEEERIDAMMVLNNLFLRGYSDLWICIALIKIMVRQDYFRDKYLLSFESFIDEVSKLEKKFNKLNDITKDTELSYFYDGSDRLLTVQDRAQIDEYSELFNEFGSTEEVNDFLDYLYMKYIFSYSEILNCNIEKYKFLLHGNSVAGNRDFQEFGF